ncbi:MAG TPA: DUF1573 domain-containing protein [Bacteroidales bacterium]|nr:DUF1573 domain-containing protein [Bacteroidales bacterium]
MKKTNFVLYVLYFLLIVSCNRNNSNNNLSTDLVNNPNTASGKQSNDILPVFQFEEEEHDFGNIVEGEKVTYSFRFKNVGKSDLIISQAHASCGCTNLEYPKQPIKPGEQSYISVTFDSKNRKGYNTKTVSLIANTQPNEKILKITANVIAP